MRTTFGKIKATLAKVINLNASDARVLDYCNRAQERLLYEGKWKDTVITYVICTSNACLTWPREIETIEAVSVCDAPVTVRNEWFEFLESGPGWQDSGCGSCCGSSLNLIDRGTSCSFADITNTGYKLAVYCDGTESGQILLRYYDKNAHKVYTTVSAAREEGEYITLPAAGGYAYSTFEVLPFGFYGVIKPITNRVIRIYAYKISDATLIPLAFYEPDEEVPNYRRSIIPSLSGCSSGSSCSSSPVRVRAKTRFIPVYNDNSILVIPHADAVRLAVQAIYKEENNMLADAASYWLMAENCLDKQLHHTQGDGVVAPIRLTEAELWGGGVLNLI